MKKTILNFLLFLLLTSCTPPTKQEALDYYTTIKFEIAYDVLVRLDNQKLALNEYLSNPSKLTNGPDQATYDSLISEQKEIIPLLEGCIKELENVDRLGDNAEYLENLISYCNVRLKLEENTMLRIVELLENGMTPEEAIFLNDKTNQLLDLQKQQEKLFTAEENFFKEFGIIEEDIESQLIKKGY